MNIDYVFIGIGIASMVLALVWRDWALMFTGFSLLLSGWTHRRTQPSPWIKHPTLRDTWPDTTNEAL